jgi:hypothetical protein
MLLAPANGLVLSQRTVGRRLDRGGLPPRSPVFAAVLSRQTRPGAVIAEHVDSIDSQISQEFHDSAAGIGRARFASGHIPRHDGYYR